MNSFIMQIIIGLIVIVIGIFNMKGNISSLHSYHRKRVKKEDVIPFGKRVGFGSILIGSSIIIAGILSMLNILFEKVIYTYTANGVLLVGFIVGLIVIFHALFKYNKGIF